MFIVSRRRESRILARTKRRLSLPPPRAKDLNVSLKQPTTLREHIIPIIIMYYNLPDGPLAVRTHHMVCSYGRTTFRNHGDASARVYLQSTRRWTDRSPPGLQRVCRVRRFARIAPGFLVNPTPDIVYDENDSSHTSCGAYPRCYWCSFAACIARR